MKVEQYLKRNRDLNKEQSVPYYEQQKNMLSEVNIRRAKRKIDNEMNQFNQRLSDLKDEIATQELGYRDEKRAAESEYQLLKEEYEKNDQLLTDLWKKGLALDAQIKQERREMEAQEERIVQQVRRLRFDIK